MEKKYQQNWHLAKTDFEFNATEFELALIRFNEAFSRYVMSVGTITMDSDVEIKYQEYIILHVVRMLDRPKNSTMIARIVNRDDIPNIQYSLRKLESAGLIEKKKDRNSKTFSYIATEKGAKVTDEYNELRSKILISRLEDISGASDKFEKGARFLSLMTGIYEEAARDSATFAPRTAD